MIARRLVVRARDAGLSEQGTAWFVSSELVFTAFHVVGQRSVAQWAHELDETRSYWLDDEDGVVELHPVAFDARTDVALLRVGGSVPSEVLELAAGSQPRTAWEARAYPGFNRASALTLSGTVAAVTDEAGDRAVQLTVDQGTAVDWRGVSGSAVVDAEHKRVIGMITNVTDLASTAWAASARALQGVFVLAEFAARVARHPLGIAAECFAGVDADRIDRILERIAQTPGSTDIGKLAASLRQELPALARRDVSPCPYPGMRPFSASHQRSFYGRTKEVDELVARLRRGEREIYVVGPSGSGKSSLVTAGLLPRLDRGDDRQGYSFIVRTLRPGPDPAQRLAEAIESQDSATTAWPKAVRALLSAASPNTRALIFIDQFEEAFTLADASHRRVFFDAIRALRAEPLCFLVMSMRADFYGALVASDLWPDIEGNFSQLTVGPLRGAALRQAIETPARDVGVIVDAELVERLIADAAAEPGVLPLLQETLVYLWAHRKAGRLSLAQYEELGDRERSGLALAITSSADATMRSLTPHQRAIARRTFLRLVSFAEGRADARRQQRIEDLRAAGDDRADFDVTIRRLTDDRLLTVGSESQTTVHVDLSHEALIVSWATFDGWLKTRRSNELRRRQLEDKAAEWVARGRGAASLLDDVELSEARLWLASEAGRELGQSDDLSALVRASVAARWRRIGLLLGSIAALSIAAVVGTKILRAMQSRAHLAEEQASTAEYVNRRLLAASACNCALVQFLLPPNARLQEFMEISSDGSEHFPPRSITDKLPDAGVFNSETSVRAGIAWFGEEALLPPGDYRIEYEHEGVSTFYGFHSDGVGQDRAVALPVPIRERGFTYVAGGDCAPGSDDGVGFVSPFLIANDDTSARVSWSDAALMAFTQGSRLPTRNELVCARRMGVSVLDKPRWRWTGTVARADPKHPTVYVADGTEETSDNPPARAGAIDGLARVRFARSAAGSAESAGEIRLLSFAPHANEIRRAIVRQWAARKGALILLKGPKCEVMPQIDALEKEGAQLDSIYARLSNEGSDVLNMDQERGVLASVESSAPAEPWMSGSQIRTQFERCRIITEGSEIRIFDAVRFRPRTAEILPSSREILVETARTLRSHDFNLVQIRGHAFDVPRDLRQALSLRRAEAARAALIHLGVAPQRLTAKGVGDSEPLGCTDDVALLARRDQSIEQMRKSEAWSDWAEENYLLGTLQENCAKPAGNDRLEFRILQSGGQPTGVKP